MTKLYWFLVAGLFLGSVSIAGAARPPDYVKDLNRWMGKDPKYYEQRWDPDAERYTQFENKMRDVIEKGYRDEEISRREYRNLRNQLAAFDDHLRRALDDGELSWTEKRILETRQEEVKGDIQEALLNREYYPYRNPHDFEAFDRTEKKHKKG